MDAFVAAVASIVLYSTPLIFATIGETITEKAGVINLSLDGSIMLAAMAGFAGAYLTGNVWLGFVAGGIVAMLVALIVAFSSISLKLNQVAVGFVLALLCTDLSTFLGNNFVRIQGPSVPHMPIPLLENIPILGPIFFDQDLVVYASLILIVVAWWFMFKTRRGLILQGIGERPEAAFARGVPVNQLRYLYVALGGLLVGVGGAAFSLDVKLGWSYHHTSGFGWIALAIVIFGGWHPFRVAFGTYLFGVLQILALKLQSVVPNLAQVLPILPFPLMIFTLLIVYNDSIGRMLDKVPRLAGLVRSEPPSGLGKAFEQE
ncbi:MAG TPA: ABC transporter permease [Anaerolineae bacterium]|nr:ABC transporter permease [Anaerolineae bacterium]